MKRRIIRVVAYLFLVVSGICLYLYWNDGLYAIDSKFKNKAIQDLIVSESTSEDPLDRKIDFEKLRGINEDVVGWLYIPGTTVDYPILIGSDDESYLYNDINKEYNPLGSIFSYANTSRDLSDGHVMLFGHNMASSQMFGQLKKFVRDESFMHNNRKFYVYLDTKVMEFDIFSIFTCNENDDFFSVGRELGTMDYVDFVTDVIKRNVYSDYVIEDSKISSTDSQVFSLVTCHGSQGTSERLVVNGAVVREKYYIN